MNEHEKKSLPQPSCRQPQDDEIAVFVEGNGDVLFIHNDNVLQVLKSALGEVDVRRASSVEYDGYAWCVDVSPLIGGPERIVAMAERRDEALAAEVSWLKNYLEGSHEKTLAMPALSESEPGRNLD